MMKFKTLLIRTFDFRLFILLSLAFIAFTVIGTLSHEAGHYAMARYLGLQASIHYNYTDFHLDPSAHLTPSPYLLPATQSAPSPHPLPKEGGGKVGSNTWKQFPVRLKANQAFWLFLGGPLQTMLTGTLGLILLILFRRRFFTSEHLSFGLWFVVFITLFWLRQTTNLVSALVSLLFRGSVRSHGDEFYLARHFHLPSFTLLAITGLAGLAILLVVIFRFIPLKQRLTFISAGVTGGVVGFVSWLVIFGKMILP